MTDRELLKLAAKAAGIEICGWTDGDKLAAIQPEGFWNPLTRDGDALRLAVKLHMEVYHGNDEGEAAYASYSNLERGGAISYCIEYYDDLSHKGDALSATRRAIVRAAAEVGRAL